MNKHYQCIVIGAGPAGIITIKELAENGITDILAIDQGPAIGGNFIHSYDNLTLTSSCTISMFSDFWIGDGNERSFWTKHDIVKYWKQYIKKFNIADKFRFNTNIESANLENDTWSITLSSVELLTADKLVIAIGSSNFKSLPDWHEKLTNIKYLHSKDYRNAEELSGKNVIVVGGGESASDIALEVSKVAATSWVSLRTSCGWITPRFRGSNPADLSTHRGFWGLPREFGKPAAKAILDIERNMHDPEHDAIVMLNNMVTTDRGPFGTYGTKTKALPEAIAYHNCQVIDEITEVLNGGKTLITRDGNRLENIDVVIFSTGYKNIIPFFSSDMAHLDPRSLYKHMFHSDYRDKLCLVGAARPCFGSQFPIMEMQARYFALIASGKAKLPSATDMQLTAEADKAMYIDILGHNAKRVRSLVDYHIYLDNLAKIIGCSPPLWKYFFLHPLLWMRMVYGPMQSTQFRLRGPNRKTALAHDILRKIPVSDFTHIVKIGIIGRIKYALKGKLPGQDLVKLTLFEN